PEVTLNADYTPSCPPMLVNFTAQATGLAGIAKWEWDLGNGVRTTTLEPTLDYAYLSDGVFDVTLTATDSNGCATTIIMNDMITVLGDVIPDPIVMRNVSVLSGNTVEVIFSPHNDDDFQYYTVYREEEGVGFVPIQQIEYINDTVFYDQDATPEQSNQCYKVTVTNYCGSESNLGQTDQHCTIEASTTILTNQILVRWTPYIDWGEVEQYEVYSVDNYNPDQVEFLAVLPGTALQYTEPVENCFNDLSYRIRAVGKQPEQVSWSDTTAAISEVQINLQGTRVIRATIQNNDEILLEWDDFNIPGASILYIEKSIDGGAFNLFATLPPGETKFRDLDVNIANFSYSYRIYAQDSCGSRTVYSNEGKTVLLDAKKEGIGIKLTWTTYRAWRFGVRQYQIEVFNESTNLWELVDIVQGTESEYLDTQTNLEQGSYCYRIRALELGGNEAVSLSNEACVIQETLIFAPSAFTPNGDGNNDFFEVKGILIESARWRVFSRWGMLLYEGNSLEDRWDGTYRGDLVKDGVYVYVVEGVGRNGQNFSIKGTVTLIR
ncbi:MAG: gliding motility-associated C-terminal domain-containing protein, partial [Bacteroidota bacterium]